MKYQVRGKGIASYVITNFSNLFCCVLCLSVAKETQQYHLSTNTRRGSNKRGLLISATPLSIQTEIAPPSNKRRTSKYDAY